MNLPNAITLARIAVAAILPSLILWEDWRPRALAFGLFLAAALSDLWDGYLARSRNLVTDLGKLLDPVADKLLVATTLVSFYVLSHVTEPTIPFPWWTDRLPLWVVAVILGRELAISILRAALARRGRVLAAGREGKIKAVAQNIASGAVLLWYTLHAAATRAGWAGGLWQGWQVFHRSVAALALTVALVLTIYSLAVYVWRLRVGGRVVQA